MKTMAIGKDEKLLKVVGSTEKAIKVEVQIGFSSSVGLIKNIWVPKSVSAPGNEERTLAIIPVWILKKNISEGLSNHLSHSWFFEC